MNIDVMLYDSTYWRKKEDEPDANRILGLYISKYGHPTIGLSFFINKTNYLIFDIIISENDKKQDFNIIIKLKKTP